MGWIVKVAIPIHTVIDDQTIEEYSGIVHNKIQEAVKESKEASAKFPQWDVFIVDEEVL